MFNLNVIGGSIEPKDLSAQNTDKDTFKCCDNKVSISPSVLVLFCF